MGEREEERLVPLCACFVDLSRPAARNVLYESADDRREVLLCFFSVLFSNDERAFRTHTHTDVTLAVATGQSTTRDRTLCVSFPKARNSHTPFFFDVHTLLYI